MKEQDEIEIRKLLSRAAKDWKKQLLLWQNDPHSFVVDEPFYEEYLIEEIYNYKHGK
jgi:hypothetical protein